MESPPSKAKDPSETIPGLRQSHNLYPIHHFVPIMLGNQNHFVTRSCQRLGFFMEDASVKCRMNCGEMNHFHNFHNPYRRRRIPIQLTILSLAVVSITQRVQIW
jgi:hypothetical protein